MDDILTREIVLPDLNALPLDPASFAAPYLEIIDQQARLISSSSVKINALATTCQAQAEQIAALKTALNAPAPDKITREALESLMITPPRGKLPRQTIDQRLPPQDASEASD